MNLRYDYRRWTPQHPLTYLGVINAGANYGSAEKMAEVLRETLTSLYISGRTVVTHSLDELKKVLQENRHSPPEVVGIGGGDATSYKIITEMYRQGYPTPEMLLIYTLGTANLKGAAYSLGGGLADKLFRRSHLPTMPLRLADYFKTSTLTI